MASSCRVADDETRPPVPQRTSIFLVGPSPTCKVAMITVSPGTVMYRAVHCRPFSATVKNGIRTLRTINVLGPLRPDKHSAISDKACFNAAYERAWSVEEARNYLWEAQRSLSTQLPSQNLVAYEIEVNETSQDFGPLVRMSRAVIRVDLGNLSSILRGPWRDSRTTSSKDMDACVQQFVACGYPAAARIIAGAHQSSMSCSAVRPTNLPEILARHRRVQHGPYTSCER